MPRRRGIIGYDQWRAMRVVISRLRARLNRMRGGAFTRPTRMTAPQRALYNRIRELQQIYDEWALVYNILE